MQVLFHPSGSIVSAYQVHTGKRLLELRGHMGTINAACWSRRCRALLTGSADRSMLAWTADVGAGDVCFGGDAQSDASQDAWSDEEVQPLDALGVGDRNSSHGNAPSMPFSGGRELPHVSSGAHAQQNGDQCGNGRGQGWRPAGRLGVAHGRIAAGRGRGRGQRRGGAPPSRRIQRIAARLINSLHPHLPASDDAP